MSSVVPLAGRLELQPAQPGNHFTPPLIGLSVDEALPVVLETDEGGRRRPATADEDRVPMPLEVIEDLAETLAKLQCVHRLHDSSKYPRCTVRCQERRPEAASSGRRDLLDHGYAVFMVRHGSAPLFKVPDAVADVRRAVRYIRLNEDDFGIDADRLGVTGGSAGGHLSPDARQRLGRGEPRQRRSDRTDRKPRRRGRRLLPAGRTCRGLPARTSASRRSTSIRRRQRTSHRSCSSARTIRRPCSSTAMPTSSCRSATASGSRPPSTRQK